ncbi:hypothetical protein DSECCO2_474000 [anaerobic digester metagenome]
MPGLGHSSQNFKVLRRNLFGSVQQRAVQIKANEFLAVSVHGHPPIRLFFSISDELAGRRKKKLIPVSRKNLKREVQDNYYSIIKRENSTKNHHLYDKKTKICRKRRLI